MTKPIIAVAHNPRALIDGAPARSETIYEKMALDLMGAHRLKG
jgi:hypothetical protein